MAAQAPAPLASYKPPCSLPARLLAHLTQWPRAIEVIWRAAWVAGRVRRWLTSGWRRPTLGIGVAAAVLYAFDRWIRPLSWLSFWSTLAVAIIGMFAVAVWRARGRVVIEPFVDYNKAAASTEDGTGQAVAPGLNDALVSELAALRELYRAVGERAEVDPAVGNSGQPVDATLELQDVSEFLQNASTGDATVSVGPFALPIGTVLAMLGRLAQGPRVTGGLQLVTTPAEDDGTSGGEIVLTAYYSGPNRRASWSVREPLPDYAASLLKTEEAASVVQTAAVRGMVQELAARIFADLALEGTRSWRATRRFLEGLRQYRLAHESQQDRVLKLRRAERAFIEALADDVDLTLARYNLGVVYRELHYEAPTEDFDKAAENAFRRELQREQPSWQPYYALAVTCYEQGRHADVSSLCDRVIELADGPARKAMAYDLKGLADRLRDGSPLGLAKAIESRRKAVAHALLALCDAELRSNDQRTMRGLAARCLLDLGIGLAYSARGEDGGTPKSVGRRRAAFRSCCSVFHSAARLEDSFAIRSELGKIGFEFGDPELAVRQLRAAVRIDPTSSVCWAWLAKVNAVLSAEAQDLAAQADWEQRSWTAVKLARANLDLSDGWAARETTDELAQALGHLGREDEAERARQIPYVEGGLVPESDVSALEARLASETDAWARGQVARRLGEVLRAAEEHEKSAQYFQQALEELRDEYGAEARRLGLQGMVALALASQDQPQAPLQEALRDAQGAIAVDPLSSWERETLGRILQTIGDDESAIAAYEYALFWQPNSPRLHSLLGSAYWRLAEYASDPVQRKQIYRQATAHLESALVLQPQSELAARTAAHYELGRAYMSADEFDRAVPHFRNALPDVEAKPVVQALMGEAYVRMRHYTEAEDVLAQAIEAAEAAAEEDPRGAVGESLEVDWLAAEAAAYAHRMMAMSLIDRDVRLDEARSHVQESERLLDALEDKASATDRASGRELEGRILLEEGKHDAAIASLNESVGLSADVEAYFHLGRAYKEKAATSRRKADRELAFKRARRAYLHAQDLSRSEMFQEAITSDVAELDALSPPESADPDKAATEEPALEPAS